MRPLRDPRAADVAVPKRRSRLLVAIVLATCAACGSDDYAGYFSIPPTASRPPDQPPTPRIEPPRAGLHPEYGPTRRASRPPVPLSGGTLIVSRDGGRAIASDPDRDRVYIVDLVTTTVEREVVLEEHDEPGRIAEDGRGHFHVSLRGGGAILSIPPDKDGATTRRHVCPAPRGIAYHPTNNALLVVCENGEVRSFDAASDASSANLLMTLAPDLRDVLVMPSRTLISTFRSAEIFELAPDNRLKGHRHLPAPGGVDVALVAFRMVAAVGTTERDSDPLIVHEAARMTAVSPTPGGYSTNGPTTSPSPSSTTNTSVPGANCRGSIVSSVVTRIGGMTSATAFLPTSAVLTVDMATDGMNVAVIAAGNGHTTALPQLLVGPAWNGPGPGCPATFAPMETARGQLTSVAFRRANALVVLSQEPAQLELLPERTVIPLSASSREDTGHAVFHSNAGAGIACASCHPEGGEDGHVWDFAGVGGRRTQSLRGTLMGTAPFHWNGDVKDIAQIADDALTGRMSGPRLDESQKQALESWLFAIPPPRPVRDRTRPEVERGRALFATEMAGCGGCHAGPRLTNGANADVGTGGPFQVPSLVGVAMRRPLMHGGCAATLLDSFTGGCGGSAHGRTAHLSSNDLADLAFYLESL